MNNTNKRIEINTYSEGWNIVKEIAGDKGFTRDGNFKDYPIYRSEDGDWVSDLNTRLELNLKNGKTINIWFSDLALKLIKKDAEIEKLDKQIEDLKKQIDWLAKKADTLQKANDEKDNRIAGFEEVIKNLATAMKALNQYAA